MRLLLVEDDEHVAAALLAVLARHGITAVHARGGAEAVERVQEQSFDAVLLDLGLPDVDGFEVCGQIRRLARVPVIMVTARADVRSRIHGLNLGADDYVVKPYDTGELLARIHAVSRRSAAESAEAADAAPVPSASAGDVLSAGPITVDLSTRRVQVDGRSVDLTRKEFDLLALLAQRPGVVFRREQIISEVWQTSWEGTGRTLEVHIGSLRAKLRRGDLVETVRGVGYRLALPTA